MTRTLLAILGFALVANAFAAGPLIRFGRGFAAEEQVWLMSARPDLTPNQGKRYELKQILFQANPERFQAFLAGELDAGTAPGLAVIFARAQGMDMKIVASICLEAKGERYFTTTYMVKDDGPVKTIQDLKGGTIGVVGIKTATDLWARAGLINAGLVPDKDTKVVPMAFPVIGDAVRTGKVSAGTFVEPFLLNADGSQHRAGRGASRGIGERELSLPIGFLKPTLLHQGGRLLEGRLRLAPEGGGRRQRAAHEHGPAKGG